ncbi:MAG: hypothetical protein K0U72_06465 [Gammaproteobacteria bacterium]|nr:hypothetical protein [Gammaproteobacteria bacterium]
MGLLAKLMGRETGHEPRAPGTQQTCLYRGVQIVAGDEGCCRVARILEGQRFLSDEIPKLPLEQCDQAECRCGYKLYNDRRTGEQRLSDFGYDIISELRTSNNRRNGGGDRRLEREDGTAVLGRIASAFHKRATH